MKSINSFELKRLNKQGLSTLMQWALKEGWNPGENDIDAFWDADPDGFYGIYNENELIAGGAVISYNQEFGFMGLFIVHPDFRGKGIGNKLWYLRRDLLINRLNTGAPIGMDGVVAMQPFYEKGGFKKDFRDERYEFQGQKSSVSNKLSSIKSADIDTIMAYDLKRFGFPRTEFLKTWLTLPNSKGFKYVEKDLIKGYAVIRKVKSGYKIGPLFAENKEIAEEIFKACLNTVEGQSVYLDIPVINEEAVKLVKKYNGKYVFECARMYYGEVPKVDVGKVFGITTFELG
ncbi:GNAT family N-acetyltransferase [Brumimicrobium mesophilum]|uniref:GNAT family N-acetyltransferase n=1 Tax=Brumimicrobium mesophilum TaxID=392717 RepID=UPI000D143910|nr:GNAT family N-acetyltransferase [Brumimicrobium mesophilum]